MGVEARLMRNRFAGVLRRPGELKGLGTVERRRSANLARLLGVDLDDQFSIEFRYENRRVRLNIHQPP